MLYQAQVFRLGYLTKHGVCLPIADGHRVLTQEH